MGGLTRLLRAPVRPAEAYISMLAAFGWNVLAWALWGLLILGFRYRVERGQQNIAEREALASLEAPASSWAGRTAEGD